MMYVGDTLKAQIAFMHLRSTLDLLNDDDGQSYMNFMRIEVSTCL